MNERIQSEEVEKKKPNQGIVIDYFAYLGTGNIL